MSGPRKLTPAAIAGLEKIEAKMADPIVCQEIQNFLLEQKDPSVEADFAASVEKVDDGSWQLRKSRCEAISLAREVVIESKESSDLEGVVFFKKEILDVLNVSDEKKLELARRIYFQHLIASEFSEENYFAEDANELKEILLDEKYQLLKTAVESLVLVEDKKLSADDKRNHLKNLFVDVSISKRKEDKDHDVKAALKRALKAFKPDQPDPTDELVNKVYAANQLCRFRRKYGERYAKLSQNKIQELKDKLEAKDIEDKTKNQEQALEIFKKLVKECTPEYELEKAEYRRILKSGKDPKSPEAEEKMKSETVSSMHAARTGVDEELAPYYERSVLPPYVKTKHLISWLDRQIVSNSNFWMKLGKLCQNPSFLERLFSGKGSVGYRSALAKFTKKGSKDFIGKVKEFVDRFTKKDPKETLEEFADQGRSFILALFMTGHVGYDNKKYDESAAFLGASLEVENAFLAHRQVALQSHNNFALSKPLLYKYLYGRELKEEASKNSVLKEKLTTLRANLDKVLKIKWESYQDFLTSNIKAKLYKIDSKHQNVFNNLVFIFHGSEELPKWMAGESLIKLIIYYPEILKQIEKKTNYKVIVDRVFNDGEHLLGLFKYIAKISPSAVGDLRKQRIGIVKPHLERYFSNLNGSALPSSVKQEGLVDALICCPDFFVSMKEQKDPNYSAVEERLFGKDGELSIDAFEQIAKLARDVGGVSDVVINFINPYLTDFFSRSSKLLDLATQRRGVLIDFLIRNPDYFELIQKNPNIKAIEDSLFGKDREYVSSLSKHIDELIPVLDEKAERDETRDKVIKIVEVYLGQQKQIQAENEEKRKEDERKAAEQKKLDEEKRKQEESDRREREKRLAEDRVKEEEKQREKAREDRQAALSHASGHMHEVVEKISNANTAVHHQLASYASLFHPVKQPGDPAKEAMLPKGIVARTRIDFDANNNLHEKIKNALSKPELASYSVAEGKDEIIGKGVVAINYVQDPNQDPAAGCYSEYFSPVDHQYRIAVQRMPTWNGAPIFHKAFEELNYQSKPDVWGALTSSQLRNEKAFESFMQQNFSGIANLDYEAVRKKLSNALQNARVQEVPGTNPIQKVSSDHYLNFVNKQFISFAAAVGFDKKIYIRPCKDDELLRAYILIAEAANLNYVNESGKDVTITEEQREFVRGLYATGKLEKTIKVDFQAQSKGLQELAKEGASPTEVKEAAKLVSKMQSGIELNNNERKRLKELKDLMDGLPVPPPASPKQSS